MATGTFTANANIKGSGTAPRVLHAFVSGVDDGVDATKVRPTNWDAEHTIIGYPTRTAYRDVAVTNGSTVTLGDDTTIARIGAALIFNMDGNDGACLIQYYRAGSFNTVVGTSFGGSAFEFRGTTFSAGSVSFSIFLASNSAGAALKVKDNAGFSRTIRILEFATTGNLT